MTAAEEERLPPASLAYRDERSVADIVTAATVLLAIALLQGVHASRLNDLYYAAHGPFYDSSSYYSRLATIISVAQQDGPVAGLQEALHESTVFLPFGVAAVLAPFLEIDRKVGVWLQVPLVWMMLLSVWACFRHVRGVRPAMALLLTLPFAGLKVYFSHAAGLSDFRFDLSLFLLFGAAVAWLFLALHRRSLLAWGISGLFVGLCALTRTTTPLYVALVFGPVVAFELVFRRQPVRRLLEGTALAAGVTILISGWFYIINWDYIHYYYFTWNLHAKAGPPSLESLKHLYYPVGRHIGFPLLAACVAALVYHYIRAGSHRFRTDLLRLDTFPLLVAAAAPAGFLALTGRGPNHFASMPSAFGILMLLLLLPRDWKSTGLRGWPVYLALLLMGCLYSPVAGNAGHLHPPPPRSGSLNPRAMFESARELLQFDARARGLERVRIGIGSLDFLNADALRNHLIFEGRCRVIARHLVADEVTEFDFRDAAIFSPAQPVEWQFSGAGVAEEAALYIAAAAKRLDYLILPDGPSISHLEQMPWDYINQKVRAIHQAVEADPAWRPIGAVTDGGHMTYQLYALRDERGPASTPGEPQ